MDTPFPQNSSVKTSESKIPEPPPLEVDIRTMESDLKAFKEGGGELPGFDMHSPFTVRREEKPMERPTIDVPGYSGPEKGIFSASGEMKKEDTEESPYGKLINWIVVALVFIIGLGLLGYYVVFPLLFK